MVINKLLKFNNILFVFSKKKLMFRNSIYAYLDNATMVKISFKNKMCIQLKVVK